MSSTGSTAGLGLPMVYLVDDEDVIRDALAWLLRSRRLLSEGHASAEDFLAFVDSRLGNAPATETETDTAIEVPEWPHSPSCLLLDVRMPGISGLALFERLVARGLTQTLPVIFLTGHGDVPTAVSAVKQGAFDFVEKPFSDNHLVDRVQLALDHSAAAIRRAAERRRTLRAVGDLTDREQEVMRLVMEGLPNKLIADALDISVRTVEVHRARVFDKMGVRSAVELVNRLNPPEDGEAPAEPRR